jgi:integrase
VLTDIACRNTKKNGALQKLSDGGGLQLWIQPTGSRQWRLAYRYAGKQKLLALGPYAKDEVTAHGFRATASTLLNESGLWSADAIERQLAHVETNEIRRAYARGEHWEERVRMMAWWAEHLEALRAK